MAALHGRAFVERLRRRGVGAALLTFPAGERFKTRDTKARLEDRLAGLGAARDSRVVAMGGGVTGDLAGFLAATWHRGLVSFAIPTTLLAMVDAALGGKTGVDLPAGKNLVGAFHQPSALFADVDVLKTLPERVYRDGLAEVVKTAVVCDAQLFARLERNAPAIVSRDTRVLAGVIARCLELKGGIVSRDERESGRRVILNFGHTAAHAIEAATDYRTSHGRAVAAGMVAEATLAAHRAGFPERDLRRIETLLRTFGLPVRAPRGLDRGRLASAMRRDKKTREGSVRIVVPAALGRVRPGAETLPVDETLDLIPLLAPN